MWSNCQSHELNPHLLWHFYSLHETPLGFEVVQKTDPRKSAVYGSALPTSRLWIGSGPRWVFCHPQLHPPLVFPCMTVRGVDPHKKVERRSPTYAVHEYQTSKAKALIESNFEGLRLFSLSLDCFSSPPLVPFNVPPCLKPAFSVPKS